MKPSLSLAVLLLATCSDSFPVFAEDLGKLVFEDTFNRNETQEEKDEVGNGWTTNADKPWSKGKKQADLRDGALYVTPADGKQSGLLVIRPADFRDGTIQFRFQLPNATDQIGLMVADKNLKNVHAGHVMNVWMHPGRVKVSDMLNGSYAPEIYKRRKAGQLTKEDKAQIAASGRTFPAPIEVQKWHSVTITTMNDRLTVQIDGQQVGRFSSPSFAHHKTILRISFRGYGAIDDFKLHVADSLQRAHVASKDSGHEPDAQVNPFVGDWALTMPSGAAAWFSVTQSDRQIGAQLWTVGFPSGTKNVRLDGDVLQFDRTCSFGKPDYPGGRPSGPKLAVPHRATVSGNEIFLVMECPAENGKVDERKFGGTRLPPMPPQPDLSKVAFGDPIELFNGQDLTGWQLTNSAQINGWKAANGELVNTTPKKTFEAFSRYGNLRTDAEFEDFNLKLEFNVPEGGNSGVYLRGMYEAQVVDRDSRMQGIQGVGAVFGRIAPVENAGKSGGSWQAYDLTLVDRHITVKLNGKTVVDNQPVVGCTKGALSSDVMKPGPIYLQGDHTAVRYRNIVLRPVVKSHQSSRPSKAFDDDFESPQSPLREFDAGRGNWTFNNNVASATSTIALLEKNKKHGPIIKWPVTFRQGTIEFEMKPEQCQRVTLTLNGDGHVFRWVSTNRKPDSLFGDRRFDSALIAWATKSSKQNKGDFMDPKPLPHLDKLQDQWVKVRLEIDGDTGKLSIGDAQHTLQHAAMLREKTNITVSFGYGQLSIRNFGLSVR